MDSDSALTNSGVNRGIIACPAALCRCNWNDPILEENNMNTLRRMISFLDAHTLWAFNPQAPLDRTAGRRWF